MNILHSLGVKAKLAAAFASVIFLSLVIAIISITSITNSRSVANFAKEVIEQHYSKIVQISRNVNTFRDDMTMFTKASSTKLSMFKKTRWNAWLIEVILLT